MPADAPPTLRHGGRILADQLRILGADMVFCVPGESFLGLLDGLHDHRNAIRTIACRHESGATNMAEAHAKLTGRPGIAAVTRGPGATNGANGLHTAYQDSTPMILFVGQVARAHMDREAFQEIDYRRFFGQTAKWVAQIDDVARIPEYVARAWATSLSGRPGPVVLALPEETLAETADAPDCRPHVPAVSAPSATALEEAERLLARAKTPLMLIGGPGWTARTAESAARFAEAQGLPVVTAFRRQDYMDNAHPNFCGTLGIGANPALVKWVREECDLILNLGSRLGEIASQGYELIDIPAPRQTLIHVHPGTEELGSVYQPDLAFACTAESFLDHAAALPPQVPGPGLKRLREAYEAFSVPPEPVGALDMGAVMQTLDARLPQDAIISNGAGNYTVWLHRFRTHRAFRTQLAPTSGSMGYGPPAAVAAKLTHPGRTVIAMGGDGCFLMTAQELATARQYDAPVISLVVNNGMFGTIRMHQERHYPGRTIATDLFNPDFVMLARAYGGEGERVKRTEDFAPALERALASEAAGRSYLIELAIDPEALTPAASLSEIRAEGEARQQG